MVTLRPSGHLEEISVGCPILPRFLRLGGDFDFASRLREDPTQHPALSLQRTQRQGRGTISLRLILSQGGAGNENQQKPEQRGHGERATQHIAFSLQNWVR